MNQAMIFSRLKQRIHKRLYEFSVSGHNSQIGAVDIIEGVFVQLGIQYTDIIQSNQDSRFAVTVFFPSLKKTQLLKDRITKLNLTGVKFKIVKLDRADWQDKWKKDFSPFSLTKRIDVVPAWRLKDYKIKEQRDYIIIDTVSAFGTGLHDTTRFMSLFIEECRGKFHDFLDIGTGTGILALVASKCGAKRMVAIDNDKEPVRVARENLLANNCRICRLKKMDVKDFQSGNVFDFVAANLTSFDLSRLKKKIVFLVKPGKFLAISGISIENFKQIKNEFAKFPLKCLRIHKSVQWCGFLFQRKST